MDTIASRLREIAGARPGRIFSTFLAGEGREEITFAALYDRSRRYASLLARMGVQRGDVVLIVLQHTPHLFYAFLGAVLAGAIPSFMPFPSAKQRPDIYWRSHEALFDRIKPSLILTYTEIEESLRNILPNAGLRVVSCSAALLDENVVPESRMPGLSAAPGDIACLQHSSGTTGLKKGVVLTHRIILGQIEAYAQTLGFGPDDSIASWLPLYHDMGFVACFLMSVVRGTHLVALDPFEWVMRPDTLLDAIQRYRTSFCWLPNFAFTHICNSVKPDATWNLTSMRAFINCSEPCKAVTFERFVDRFGSSGVTVEKLQVCYAMAENVFAVTQTRLDRSARTVRVDAADFARGEIRETTNPESSLRVVSCGSQLEGVQAEIVDASGVLPEGRIGEIRLTGPFVFDGYYRLPDATGARLRDGWYYTADMGFVLDGEVFVTGRKDDMLIINGRNYYAHEIEAAVNTVAGIVPGRNIAIAVDDPATDATVAVVLAECQPDTDTSRLRRDVRREVQNVLGLAVHSFVPLLPGTLVKTTSGKISRTENRKRYLDGSFRT